MVRLYDLATQQEVIRLEAHTDWVLSAAFDPAGKTMVTASRDGTACLWDLSTGQVVRRLEYHTGRVNTAAFCPDGKWTATASDDRLARLWSAQPTAL
jgi:WD40 repeat protein